MGDILGDIGDKKRDIGDKMGDRRETGRNFGEILGDQTFGKRTFWLAGRHDFKRMFGSWWVCNLKILYGLKYLPLNYLSLIRPQVGRIEVQ